MVKNIPTAVSLDSYSRGLEPSILENSNDPRQILNQTHNLIYLHMKKHRQ